MGLNRPTLKLIAILTLLAGNPSVLMADTPKYLQGLWESVDAKNGALPGTMLLNKDGSAKLTPKDNESLTGTWDATANTLTLTMPPYGSSTSEYYMSKKGILTLKYTKENHQSFKQKK